MEFSEGTLFEELCEGISKITQFLPESSPVCGCFKLYSLINISIICFLPKKYRQVKKITISINIIIY